MDEGLRELNSSHARARFILGEDPNIEKALQLGGETRYYPLIIAEFIRQGEYRVGDLETLFLDDLELRAIPRFYSRTPEIGPHEKTKVVYNNHLPPHELLNLPNTPTDVRIRQEGIQELIENDSLYRGVEWILARQPMYMRGEVNDLHRLINLTPEHQTWFLESIKQLEKVGGESKPFKRLQTWRKSIEEDTLFKELVRDKRKVTDRRIFTGHSERYARTTHYLLKPGINPEEVFDILSESLTEREYTRTLRSGKVKRDIRRIVKVRDPHIDEELLELPVAHSRQRMDVLNANTAELLGMPGFLMTLQLKHLYQGAYMHKKLTEEGVTMTFPQITDEQGVLEVQELQPLRMILEHEEGKREPLATNSFSFGPQDRIIQAQGPQKRGKSEAWRSIHLLSALTNAGYSIPAKSARIHPVPASHFISCKGTRGHGGSELERNVRGVEKELTYVNKGDQVILDELGDAANAPTSKEAAKRLLPPLLANGSRVFITSHQDSTANYAEEELGAISLVPDPKGKGVQQYRLLPRQGDIDFKAEEVLDEIGFTTQSVEQALSGKARTEKKRRLTRIEKYEAGGKKPPIVEGAEDIPF